MDPGKSLSPRDVWNSQGWGKGHGDFICVCWSLLTPKRQRSCEISGPSLPCPLGWNSRGRLDTRDDFKSLQQKTELGVETTLSYIFMGIKTTWPLASAGSMLFKIVQQLDPSLIKPNRKILTFLRGLSSQK